MNRKTIVGIFGDAGGAGAAAPVLKTLQNDDKIDLRLFAYRQAAGVFKDNNLVFSALDEAIPDSGIVRLLTDIAPAVLFAGTSANGVNLERRFTRISRQIGISSLAVLDFWSNYRMRFADERGDARFVPDKIAIMDERAKQEMIQEGFAPESLVVTGQPALDDLVLYGEEFTHARRLEIRAALDVSQDELLVIFGSQPLASLYTGPSDPGYPGYDENTVLPLFFSAAEQIVSRLGRPLCVLIRPHPREDSAKFEAFRGNRFRTMVSSAGDSRDVCLASDLVAGMTSMLLLFGCYLGCPTLSLQPGLNRTSPLPILGDMRAAYKPAEIEPALLELLTNAVNRGGRAARPPIRHERGAAERLLGLIRAMAGVA